MTLSSRLKSDLSSSQSSHVASSRDSPSHWTSTKSLGDEDFWSHLVLTIVRGEIRGLLSTALAGRGKGIQVEVCLNGLRMEQWESLKRSYNLEDKVVLEVCGDVMNSELAPRTE